MVGTSNQSVPGQHGHGLVRHSDDHRYPITTWIHEDPEAPTLRTARKASPSCVASSAWALASKDAMRTASPVDNSTTLLAESSWRRKQDLIDIAMIYRFVCLSIYSYYDVYRYV